jgi:hypothetical protein
MNLDPRRPNDLTNTAYPLRHLIVLLSTHGTTIANNLRDWYPGAAAGAGDAIPAPINADGTNNGPTPRRAFQPDPIVQATKHLANHLTQTIRNAEAASRIIQSLLAIDPTTATALANRQPATRADTCANCGTWVANTPQDRIRSGRCEPCYRYRKRTGTDRPKPTPPLGTTGDTNTPAPMGTTRPIPS